MHEKENRIIEEKNKETKEKKQTVFQKIKSRIAKPLIEGALILGLGTGIFAPQEGKGVGFTEARLPPRYADELLKKERSYGWECLNKAYESLDGKDVTYADISILYFKRAYEKSKKPEDLYLWIFSIYVRAKFEPSFEATERMLMEEAMPLLETRIKGVYESTGVVDIYFVDLKQQILFNIAQMYYNAYIGNQNYKNLGLIDKNKKDFYKHQAIKYSKKWEEWNSRLCKEWERIEVLLFPNIKRPEEDTKSLFKDVIEYNQKIISDILKSLEK